MRYRFGDVDDCRTVSNTRSLNSVATELVPKVVEDGARTHDLYRCSCGTQQTRWPTRVKTFDSRGCLNFACQIRGSRECKSGAVAGFHRA